MSELGYIYAVECGGRIKIGHSKKPEHRFAKIASDAPFPCDFLGCWPGSVADELVVQNKFNDIRVHGEWFAATENLLAFIADHVEARAEARKPRRALKSICEPARSIIDKLGGPTEVARIAGVHRTRVSNWARPKQAGGTGGTIPFKYVPALLEAAKARGVPLFADDFLPVKEADMPAHTMKEHPIIAEAIRLFGSQAKLAEAVDCSQQQVSLMLARRVGISAEMAVKIDRATGGKISKSDLRPDLFEAKEAAE